MLKQTESSSQSLSYYTVATEEVKGVHVLENILHQHAETRVVYSPASVFPSSSNIQMYLQVLEQYIPVFDLALDQEGK